MATKKPVKKVASKTKKPVKKVSIAKSGKKQTTKKTAKKVTKKSEKVLICADDKSCFWTKDGVILKDLIELRDAFDIMKPAIFSHHVSKDKNDFADWVEHVLHDLDCADALRKSKKPNTARTVVVRHLRHYST